MNILLINHYAGAPQYGMEYRPFYMACEWVRQGHQVTIVGADFSHLRSRQPDAGTEEIAGIRYIWLKTLFYQGNGLGRIRNMLMFLFRLVTCQKEIVGKYIPDLVIASSTYPLDIYPARWIAKRYQAKLIYEVHDLWPLSPMELGGMSKYHPFIMVMQCAENYAYAHVDRVVSMLPCAEQHMLKHGLLKGKFVYIPNGICMNEWGNKEAVADEQYEKLLSLKKEGKFIVLYAGAHGVANALKYLVQSANVISREEIVIVLIGNGQEKGNLMRLAQAEALKNVYFLQAVGKKYVPSLLKLADVLYIGLQKQPLFRFGVSPNKLFDYMMAGRPILQAIEAGNNLVSEAGCGISVAAEDADAIAAALIKMKNLSNEERIAMGMRGRAFVVQHHDYRVLAKKFLQDIES